MPFPGPLAWKVEWARLRYAPLGGARCNAPFLQNVRKPGALANKKIWRRCGAIRSELRPAIESFSNPHTHAKDGFFGPVILTRGIPVYKWPDVHFGRAIPFACLAGETKESSAFFFTVLILFHRVHGPPRPGRTSKSHRARCRAAALCSFFKRNHVAGTTNRAGIMFAAFSQSDAPQTTLRQRTRHHPENLKISLELGRFL